MLELCGIKKDYPAGDGVVHALKGIDLTFRKNEFVAILGPSGCGKTTLLNIIGGLDHYTEGDLIINGKSTKDFNDRDWDTYRNHSVGFVFQSYNLIPHQTVLQNVELALTLSGVGKAERRKRAKQALEDVGLGDQLSKHPAEMSGGQMQRVAIARALVNNPDIILADEPTGALDSETSVQVMEILKEVSKDHLVVMVTHNPDLADKYASRIIRVLDGLITDDSQPLTEEEYNAEKEECKTKLAEMKDKKPEKAPSMSIGTSFSLSLRNLFTKKGRTILTSFAGSIGIIGIALIYAVSQGMTNYIDTIQEETLSSYPLTIQQTSTDFSSVMTSFQESAESIEEHEDDAVYKKAAIYDMVDALNNMETSENDLKSFKEYIEEEREDEESESGLAEAISGVQYSYDLDLLVYTENVDGNIIYSDTESLMEDLMVEYVGIDLESIMDTYSSVMGEDTLETVSSYGMMSSMTNLWQEMLPGDDGAAISDIIYDQYDLVYGSWPNSYDEIVLVLDESNELDDMTLYALGLESEDDVSAIMEAAVDGTELEDEAMSWSYEEICDMDFRVVLNSDCYSYDETTGTYVDLRESDAGLQYLYDNALTLKVTGIIKPNEDAISTILDGTIAYTSDLTEYVIEQSSEADVIDAQLENEYIDVLTGLPFEESAGDIDDEVKQEDFLNYIDGLTESNKAQTYIEIMSIPSDEELATMTEEAMADLTVDDMKTTLITAMAEEMSMDESEVESYLDSMSDEDITTYYTSIVEEQISSQYAEQVEEQLGSMETAELAAALDAAAETYTTEQCATYYDNIMEFSDSTYDDNLTAMGYIDLDDPYTISLYASSFENKDVITDAIDAYNEDKDTLEQIQYTDYVGIMMSSVTTIINAITYVLMAFVAISLVVSCIMIAVITLISVQERTKEIGILRALGASKGNVSSMFNAETVIIGFISGLFGVILTYILCFPVDAIIHHFTGINNLNADLPISTALILILISVVLTLIAGIIPSRSAAKKDPVEALRTE